MALFDKLQKIKLKREGGRPPTGIREELDKFDLAASALEARMLDAKWQALHGKDTSLEMQEIAAENARLVGESGYAELVRSNLPAATGPDQRELALRANAITLGRIRSQPDVSQLLGIAYEAQSAYAPLIDGVPFPGEGLKNMVAFCPDSLLRAKAYYARAQAHEELGQVKLALVTALNHYSSELEGKPTYSHAVLDAQDATPALLYSHISGYEKGSRPVLEKIYAGIRESFGLKRIPPADRNFLVEQYIGGPIAEIFPPEMLLPALKRTLSLMGFGKIHGEKFIEDIDKPPFSISLVCGPRFAREECAMRAAPGTPDYRVFINADLERSDIDLMRTLLLESGRMVHFFALDRLPARSAFKTEAECMRHAVAMLFGSVVSDEKWLRDVAMLSAEDAEYLSGAFMLKQVMMKRELAAEALFELKLYHGENPVTAYQETAEIFEGEGMEVDVGLMWANHPYTAINPCGNLTYALGLMMHEVLAESVLSRYGTFLDERVALYMVDNFFTGNEMPWNERLRKIAGGR
ncbi:MAG TPA: hypothetical protein VLD37_07170 [Candidatus Bilamarchaeum sp.]|nr:hypothetical protein [Candidatus Bilamarchaeum sp.]